MELPKWKPGEYCDRCNNTGEVDCHCGGDLCVCGRQELPCPRCDGESAHEYVEGYDDDYDDERPSQRAHQGGVMPMEVYIFFRDGHFYPIELRDDDDAVANAECNPGTLRVERVDGHVVWPKPQPVH